MPWHLLVFNFLLFQSLWLLAVTFGNSLLLLLFIPALALHFAYIKRFFEKRFLWRNELLLIVLTLLIGCVIEQLAMAINVWDDTAAAFPPLFLVLLWAGFGMTLHVTFDFLHNKLWLAAILGGVFAPLSYSAGASLNPTLDFTNAITSPLIMSALWTLVFPLLIYSAQRLPLLKTAKVVPAQEILC